MNGWPSISKETSRSIIPLRMSPSMLPIVKPWLVRELTIAFVVTLKNCLKKLDWTTKKASATKRAKIKRNIPIGLSTFERISLLFKYNTTLYKQHLGEKCFA